MSIISITTDFVGQVGTNPRRPKIVSTDNLATVTGAGYLSGAIREGYSIKPTDVFDIVYGYNISTQVGTYGTFIPSFSNGICTLSLWSNPGNVLLPVVSGDVASFNGTSGQIQDSGILATNIVSKAAVNTMAAGSEIILDKGTGTESAGAVTINKQSGVITTVSLTTAAGASSTLTLTNSEIATSSVVLVSLMGGTNTTIGVQLSATAAAGSSTITISNNNASAALNGTLIIGFTIF